MNRWGELLVRWLLAGVFLYAGISKTLDVAAFATAIGRYQLLSVELNMLVATVLPYLEIYTAILLLSGCWMRAATLLSILLYTVFTVALLSAALRGLSIDCGCFGSTSGAWSSVGVALLRACALLGFSLYLHVVSSGNLEINNG